MRMCHARFEYAPCCNVEIGQSRCLQLTPLGTTARDYPYVGHVHCRTEADRPGGLRGIRYLVSSNPNITVVDILFVRISLKYCDILFVCTTEQKTQLLLQIVRIAMYAYFRCDESVELCLLYSLDRVCSSIPTLVVTRMSTVRRE